MSRIRKFSKSFSFALRGLRYIVRSEKNFQNELAVGFLVVLMAVYFKINQFEIIVLIITIGGVLIMEILNTVLERLVDILKPKVHPYARLAKDLMAASVLLVSILAIVIGCIVFIPYIFK